MSAHLKPSSTSFEALELLLELTHRHLTRDDLKSTRCLFTTSVVMDFAQRMGFKVKRWEGSVTWYSRKYVEMVKEGYDFDAIQKLPPEKARKRIQALRKKGVRSVACIANEGLEEDLGGHLCLVVRNEEQAFFVDPTCYQFRRQDKNPGGRVYAPSLLISPISPEEFGQNKDHLYNRSYMVGFYRYEPVEKFRAMLRLSPDAQSDTDLNPRRNWQLYQDLEQDILEHNIFLSESKVIERTKGDSR